jgi:hypothetical protein
VDKEDENDHDDKEGRKGRTFLSRKDGDDDDDDDDNGCSSPREGGGACRVPGQPAGCKSHHRRKKRPHHLVWRLKGVQLFWLLLQHLHVNNSATTHPGEGEAGGVSQSFKESAP